jgi:hypothetical protein
MPEDPNARRLPPPDALTIDARFAGRIPPPAAVRIDARFAGPPGSANGGYIAGRLASLLPAGAVVEVTLRQPPPLETSLDVAVVDDRASLMFGGAVIADAVLAQLTEDVVDPVPFATATEAMSTYAGFDEHPFPGCFVCGTDRPSPDGLGLRPGRVPGRPDCVATTWVPDPSVSSGDGAALVEAAWAALDCPGGWSADLVGRPMVLGRMTAAVDALPRVGDPCVVVGRWLGAERRKTFTASTLYDADGRVLGRAHATWIALDGG